MNQLGSGIRQLEHALPDEAERRRRRRLIDDANSRMREIERRRVLIVDQEGRIAGYRLPEKAGQRFACQRAASVRRHQAIDLQAASARWQAHERADYPKLSIYPKGG